jgi:hypothetical protein
MIVYLLDADRLRFQPQTYDKRSILSTAIDTKGWRNQLKYSVSAAPEMFQIWANTFSATCNSSGLVFVWRTRSKVLGLLGMLNYNVT